MNLEELRRKYFENGFSLANASAKICQDIILNKISKSKINNNIAIKGGVVLLCIVYLMIKDVQQGI